MNTSAVDRLLRCLAEVAREHAIILLDAEGNFLWWNHVAENLFGVSFQSIAGKPLSFIFTEEDNARGLPELELEIARAGVASEDDRWLRRADGFLFWATGATTCLRERDGTVLGYGKVLRNRTDLKEQFDTLRNTVQELRTREEHRTAFLSTLSHELRNPLAPLFNAAGLLRVLPAEGAERSRCLDIIDRQLAMMTRLVGDLLDLARIDAGKVELELKPNFLQTIVDHAIATVMPQVREHDHDLHVLMPSVPIAVVADEQRLQQVFTNLIANAVKYTHDGGNIWVKANVEDDDAVARIQDDGIGIAPEMLPRIFDLFTQADVTRTRSEGGLGIGLSVVRELVRLHGGSVQVRSNGIGRGSEFTVRLPLGKRAG